MPGRAQGRRKGHKSMSGAFPAKAKSVARTRKIEAEMDARRLNDMRGNANLTLKDLVDCYCEEIEFVYALSGAVRKTDTTVGRLFEMRCLQNESA